MKSSTKVTAIVLALSLSPTISAQERKLLPVTLGYSAISGSFAPLWVGVDQGLFARHGLDVRMT
jgi:ABC-type nitrate/sulfonate/bicarbonate transport system substrate-binding protein